MPENVMTLCAQESDEALASVTELGELLISAGRVGCNRDHDRADEEQDCEDEAGDPSELGLCSVTDGRRRARPRLLPPGSSRPLQLNYCFDRRPRLARKLIGPVS
jgi:hypothetical protein